MQDQHVIQFIKDVLKHMPSDWIGLTTHRLDIYDERLAKTEFLQEFETLFTQSKTNRSLLEKLPTAYDYIRLGHPLSSILEWTLAKLNGSDAEDVISFGSQTMPILAILRTNQLKNKSTQICYSASLPKSFNTELFKTVYGYDFELKKVSSSADIEEFDGSVIYISEEQQVKTFDTKAPIDFLIYTYGKLGSVLHINHHNRKEYVSAIQHVRRRETVAMTPDNTLTALMSLVEKQTILSESSTIETDKTEVLKHIQDITHTTVTPLVGSSGLSIQYAIMMGLIDDALENHKGKAIKFIVPPNCYGGTNDQARRVAACLENVEVVDLPVDGDNDMVSSINTVLDRIAKEDAIPYIIAEIPTNPRVEVPNLEALKNALSKVRKTPSGNNAIDPVFILDQTFCPNINFLGENAILSNIRTISYASGSKFPSGGKCTAGYCTGTKTTESLLSKIETHLLVCDNEATEFQYKTLAQQLPSMITRIAGAYKNTRDFVEFIKDTLPEAKLNFVSPELAEQVFTPSVFSLDLPTKGDTKEERETYKRALNLKLINLMITKIPEESKFCVSYGQLKGCYWTVPATSTQGTTKEGDKDYIVRASLSPDLDLEKHKAVFKEFVESL
jgi:cystathionine beta-lyase/cystathionine gamma-synthase